jgi:hypothetical protein
MLKSTDQKLKSEPEVTKRRQGDAGKLPPLAVLQIYLQKVPPPIRSATIVRPPTVMFLRQGMDLWSGTAHLKAAR